jgi:hypothetical protein
VLRLSSYTKNSHNLFLASIAVRRTPASGKIGDSGLAEATPGVQRWNSGKAELVGKPISVTRYSRLGTNAHVAVTKFSLVGVLAVFE